MAKVEPGRDPQMAERTRKLNLVFALTSIGLLLAVSLMVWVDYDREWKKYQIEFNKLEVKLTKEQIEQAARQGRRGASARPSRQQIAQGRAGDRGARRRGADGPGRGRAAAGQVVRHRPELPVHQGQDRRGPLRVRRGRARGQGERRPEEGPPRRAREAVRGLPARARGGRWPSGRPRDDKLAALEKTKRRRGEGPGRALRGEDPPRRQAAQDRRPASSPSCATCPSSTSRTRR